VYGIDMPSRAELVAHERTTQAIGREIGADLVIFQTLPDLISSVRQFNQSITTFDCSVFTGEYVTGGVDPEYLDRLERNRSDKMKMKADRFGVSKDEGGDVQVDKKVVGENHEPFQGSSAPMNGSDDTIGLHNSWNL
jgi:amidophosphoribosyltransferase